MKEQQRLTKLLREASDAYYLEGQAIMSDIEFDRLIEDLRKMERESGVVLNGSPTREVGAKVVDYLEKSTHEFPALSLNKVKYKDREEGLLKWLKAVSNEARLSFKYDGLTVIATYDDGKLTKAVTRGDGNEGSVITHNAVYFLGMPREIPYKGHLVVHGECLMDFDEFNRVNDLNGGIYENPRNLAAATVQMLDANESRKREIKYKAFRLIYPEAEDKIIKPRLAKYNLKFNGDRLNFLAELGFNVEYNCHVTSNNILEKVENFKELAKKESCPTDGLVFTAEDEEFGNSLGSTGHHPRGSIALKWTDDTVRTSIKDIEWSIGKTGIITPVAIFDTVRLGLGSNVSRASLHNLTIMENIPATNGDKGVKIGSDAEVYLANMIIPQIASVSNNGSEKEIKIPKVCPSCGEETTVIDSNGIKTLNCLNENCPARKINQLLNTFSKDGLFIKGLGKSQIEDLLAEKLVTGNPLSFYEMAENPDKEKVEKLINRPGWGKKKWENLLAAIEESKKTNLRNFLYSLNIDMLGNWLSTKVASALKYDVKELIYAARSPEKRREMIDHIKTFGGVGELKSTPLNEWLRELNENKEKRENLEKLIGYLEFPTSNKIEKSDELKDVVIVVTGGLSIYKNRKEFKESVESRGGRVSGSVSKKTSYLVTNEIDANTEKLQKARSLGTKIVTESEFVSMFGK